MLFLLVEFSKLVDSSIVDVNEVHEEDEIVDIWLIMVRPAIRFGLQYHTRASGVDPVKDFYLLPGQHQQQENYLPPLAEDVRMRLHRRRRKDTHWPL